MLFNCSEAIPAVFINRKIDPLDMTQKSISTTT